MQEVTKTSQITENKKKIRNSLKLAIKGKIAESLKKLEIDSQMGEGKSQKDLQFDHNGPKGQPKKVISFDDQYTMGNIIGIGSQSTIHLCASKATGKEYAVKVFKHSSEENLQNIKASYSILKDLDHERIIKVQNLFIEEKQSVKLVLEYCGTSDLRQYLNGYLTNEQKISEDEVKNILKQLFQVLMYLKRKQICHRDIKPENILYCPRTRCLKLIDFDISMQNKNEEQKMELWSNSGSVYYRAPESLKGGYDERVDMWAVGVVAYEMLTGSLPFFSKYESKIRKMIQETPVDFSKVCASNELLNLLKDMLEKDPQIRILPDQAFQHQAFCQKDLNQTLNSLSQSSSCLDQIQVQNIEIQSCGMMRSLKGQHLLFSN